MEGRKAGHGWTLHCASIRMIRFLMEESILNRSALVLPAGAFHNILLRRGFHLLQL